MFDPLTVAFDIKYPWRGKPTHFSPKGYRDTFITIWHKDPCRDGSDNSCDWHGYKKPLNKKEMAIAESISRLETILDNRPFYPDHEAHLRFQSLKDNFFQLRVRSKFRIHPRYHVWHWRIQIRPLQQLRRMLFNPCCVCKKRFKFNESVMGSWSGAEIWHHGCDKSSRSL